MLKNLILLNLTQKENSNGYRQTLIQPLKTNGLYTAKNKPLHWPSTIGNYKKRIYQRDCFETSATRAKKLAPSTKGLKKSGTNKKNLNRYPIEWASGSEAERA